MNSSGAVEWTSSGDLVSVRLPVIAPDEAWPEVAEKLFRWVEASALTTLEWYLKEKKPKARRSRILRIVAIAIATSGGVFPFVAVGASDAKLAFWGYPLLGVAAACIAADRALGFSSSWMRYQSTASMMEKMLIEHQLNWISVTRGADPGESIHDMFHRCMGEIRQFAKDLSEIVGAETEEWTKEFRGHFSELEAEAGQLHI
jgi:SMODS and SLOG-associating 2TM effector domain 2